MLILVEDQLNSYTTHSKVVGYKISFSLVIVFLDLFFYNQVIKIIPQLVFPVGV